MRKSTSPLDEKTRSELLTISRELGERRARELVGLSPEAYARALGGLNVQRGTHALVRSALDQRRGAVA